MLIGRHVAVVGAGIAGLAAATAFAMRGAKVTVFEQSAALRTEGAGIQISPNGAAVLDALGVQTEALESQAVVLRDYKAGKQVLRLDLSGRRWGRAFRLMHRGDLIAGLAQAAQSVGVAIKFQNKQGAAGANADLTVFADGVHSACRMALNPENEHFFTGQVAWRALVLGEGPPEAQVFMGPGRHLVTYPLPGGMRNIVAVEERDSWAEEGWDHADDPANLRAAFAQFSPDVQHWLRHVDDVKLWGLFRHPVPSCWHDERRVLIGDAAHPTLPFLAQGANLALEDAWILADCLVQAPQAEALAMFQSKRQTRVQRAIATANGNARNYHLRNPFVRWVAHTGLRAGGALAPTAPLKRFDWLYGFDPTKS